jgi:hypothetical protein
VMLDFVLDRVHAVTHIGPPCLPEWTVYRSGWLSQEGATTHAALVMVPSQPRAWCGLMRATMVDQARGCALR